MSDYDPEFSDEQGANGSDYAVGYRRPPLHTRFQPGVSGNPSGRAKGSKNLKTLFHEILNEEISLREGGEVKKITKAEAVLRGLVIGAIKGDPRNIVLLFKIADQCGELTEPPRVIQRIERVIISPRDFDEERPPPCHQAGEQG